MNRYSKYTYAKSLEHGKSINSNINNPADVQNPLTFCLFNNSMDNAFLHGSTASNITSHSKECQNFMADRCSGMYKDSETWDKYCKIYLKANPDTVRANEAAINQTASTLFPSNRKARTVGEKLLRNSMERRFLLYPNNSYSVQQFDPNISNTPFYRLPCNSTTGAIVKHIDKNNIDQDPLMNAALENYTSCIDVLALIWAKWKMKKLDLDNTKLEANFLANDKDYENIYEQIVNLNLSNEQYLREQNATTSSYNANAVLFPGYTKGIPNKTCKN